MRRIEFEKLIDQYIKGECTPEESRLIERSLDRAKFNKENSWAVFNEIQKKEHLDVLFQKINLSIQYSEETPVYQIQKKFKFNRMWLVVASLVAFVLIPIAYYKLNHIERTITATIWKELVAEPGQRMRIKLADGTLVWLKGGSALHYPERFDGDRRQIKLEGEAFFEVAKDRMHPFVVETSDLRIKVLGTAFNIQSFKTTANATVSLSEGSLAVNLLTDAQNPILLSPNEGITFDRNSREIKKINIVPHQTKEFFKSGDFNFDNTPLEEVFFMLGQSYGLDIQGKGKLWKMKKISGNFSRNQTADEILKSIASILGGSFTRNDKKIVMLL